MRPLILTLCVSFLLCVSNTATAANRFWIASSSSNWNISTNWATTSGGPAIAVGGVPSTTDVVAFDGNGLEIALLI